MTSDPLKPLERDPFYHGEKIYTERGWFVRVTDALRAIEYIKAEHRREVERLHTLAAQLGHEHTHWITKDMEEIGPDAFEFRLHCNRLWPYAMTDAKTRDAARLAYVRDVGQRVMETIAKEIAKDD